MMVCLDRGVQRLVFGEGKFTVGAKKSWQNVFIIIKMILEMVIIINKKNIRKQPRCGGQRFHPWPDFVFGLWCLCGFFVVFGG
jgi:hypothetical protein